MSSASGKGPIEARRLQFMARVPTSARGVIEKAFEGTASPRQAIKAGCLSCAHWDREEIRACQVVCCPLWAYRPFQDGNAQASSAG